MSAPEPIRVVIADDQPVVRRGLALFLSTASDVVVVGEAGTGPDAVRVAGEQRADVVLMDIRMPGGDGIEATRALRDQHPGTGPAVVVVTTFDTDEHLFAAIEAGAVGFVTKDIDPDDLVGAVRVAAAGDAMVSPHLTRRLLQQFAERSGQLGGTPPTTAPATAADASALTARELEIVRALADGLSNREIAERLCVEVSTVKTHLARISARLGLRDRVQLVVWAHRSGVVGQAWRPQPTVDAGRAGRLWGTG